MIDLIDLIIPYRFHCFSPISCSEEEEKEEEEEREAGDISIHEPSKQTSHRRSEQTERARAPGTGKGSAASGGRQQVPFNSDCKSRFTIAISFTSLHFTFCCIIFIFSQIRWAQSRDLIATRSQVGLHLGDTLDAVSLNTLTLLLCESSHSSGRN